MSTVMAARPIIGGALCESSLYHAQSLADVRCWSAVQ